MRSSDFVIEGGDVVVATGVLRGWSVLVQDGRIASVFPKDTRPEASSRVDATDAIVAPGFVDLHVQGSAGVDVWQGSISAIEKLSAALAAFGCTRFLATTHYDPEVIKLLVKAMGRNLKGASLTGIHLEGPFLNEAKRGAIESRHLEAPSVPRLREILDSCEGHLRMMTIAPELEGALEIIRILRQEGIVASIGHSDATCEEAARGVEAGITHATHLFNAMRPFTHREPGAAGVVLTTKGLSAQLIADGIHLHPRALQLAYWAKGVDDLVLITDAVAAAGMDEGSSGPYGHGGKALLEEGAVRLEDGTLAGSALSMNRAVKNFIEFTGAPIHEAVAMASANPARVLGMDWEVGSITRGKLADIVIMNRDFSVRETFVSGRRVWPREE